MLEKTCLNRFLGRCENCSEDYDVRHHPNNYDCPFYKEIKLSVHKVEDFDIKKNDENIIFNKKYLQR